MDRPGFPAYWNLVPDLCSGPGPGTDLPFHSDQRPDPSDSGHLIFKNDKIYLYTVWTGLAGEHEIKVLWIRPDKGVQETTRFKIKVPPNTQTYTSWAWLSFKKGLLDILPTEGKFIGPWKARLFLDEKFLMEYAFKVS